jgi:hypothetical protein
MNWLNFQRMYKALGYDFKHVQIDRKRSRRIEGRHDRRLGRLYDRRPLARAVLEGDRIRMDVRSSIRARTKLRS